MESTNVCFLLEAVFMVLCLLPSVTTTETTYGRIMEAVRQRRHMSRLSGASSPHCVTDSCAGKPDGNYPPCFSNCKDGYYFACSNGNIHKIQCPLGWFTYTNGSRYTAPMLYHRETDSCQFEASYCPTRDNSNSGASIPHCFTDSCAGKPDGNYPTCFSNCKDGYYFACSNGNIHKMQCSLGWYTHANGTRYTSPMVYQPETDSCQLEASYCLTRDNFKSGASRSHCVTDSCAGKPDGNYPTCFSNCKDGYYFACSNGNIHKMQCPLGWYTHANGSRYTAHMLYLPETDSCQLEASYCHRRDNSNSGLQGSRCVSTSCQGKPNGNYPSCSVECLDGYFYTCSNGFIYRRQCPLGWYNSVDGSRYTAPTIYIPELNTCEMEPNYCRKGVRPNPSYPIKDVIW